MRPTAVKEHPVNGPVVASDSTGTNSGRVLFQTAEGPEASGCLTRLSRFTASFELLQSDVSLLASEVLNGFKIISNNGRNIYFGRATVMGIVHTAGSMAVEVKLNSLEGQSTYFLPDGTLSPDGHAAYDNFFQKWEREYRINADFKRFFVDIDSYLTGVRQWLEQIEFSLKESGDSHPAIKESEFLETWAKKIKDYFDPQHEQFEALAYQIPPELYGAHQDFARRYWQKLFLGSPFGQRTSHKPLGFAGDYEMMEMIHRNQPEGRSLYDKLIHLLLVRQWPAESVRQRIEHLKKNLFTETARLQRQGKRARILNIGCGPARELQDFCRESLLSNSLDCTLLDFNKETLDYASVRVESERQKAGRKTRVSSVNLSVNQLLRRAVKQGDLGLGGKFDMIYCAGLFDYLSNQTCTEMVNLFYQNLQSDGLVLVANMNDSKPFRNFIEFVLDWHLIYRSADEVYRFAPERLRSQAKVEQEDTSVNLFLHLRKTE